MAKKRKSSRGRVAQIDRDQLGPTPETKAKLKPDPLNVLAEIGWQVGLGKMRRLDSAELDAGLSIREIYRCVTAPLMPKSGGLDGARGGGCYMSEDMAAEHALVYMPWCAEHGRLVRHVIDLVWEATLTAEPALLARMLRDYARRARSVARQAKAA